MDALENYEKQIDKEIIADLVKFLPLIEQAYERHKSQPHHTEESLQKVAELSTSLKSNIEGIFRMIHSGRSNNIDELTASFDKNAAELFEIITPKS